MFSRQFRYFIYGIAKHFRRTSANKYLLFPGRLKCFRRQCRYLYSIVKQKCVYFPVSPCGKWAIRQHSIPTLSDSLPSDGRAPHPSMSPSEWRFPISALDVFSNRVKSERMLGLGSSLWLSNVLTTDLWPSYVLTTCFVAIVVSLYFSTTAQNFVPISQSAADLQYFFKIQDGGRPPSWIFENLISD